jgi:hypothetical protein
MSFDFCFCFQEIHNRREPSRRRSIQTFSNFAHKIESIIDDYSCIPTMRRDSGSSMASLDTDVCQEYSALAAEWIDASCGELRCPMALLSGEDFRAFALRRFSPAHPQRAIYDATFDSSCHRGFPGAGSHRPPVCLPRDPLEQACHAAAHPAPPHGADQARAAPAGTSPPDRAGRFSKSPAPAADNVGTLAASSDAGAAPAAGSSAVAEAVTETATAC